MEKTIGTEFSFPLPPQVEYVLRRLNQAGHEAFLVGGCVRDRLRSVAPKDYDITTSARPEAVHAALSDLRLIDTGIRHGTVTVLLDGMPLEVTTYRLDGAYADHRHPAAVRFTASLREDAARRDFTVNAMAYHPDVGLCDFFGGLSDLRAGVLRAVGEPERRFREDALRILRALRFASVLSFTIEENTACAARVCAPLLSRISAERVHEEMNRLLGGPAAGVVLEQYADIVGAAIPLWWETTGNEGRRVSRIARMLPPLPPDPVLRYAAFFWFLADREDAPACLTDTMNALRFDRRTREKVTKLLLHRADPYTGGAPVLRRFLAGLGDADAAALLTLLGAWEAAADVPDTARQANIAAAQEALAHLGAEKPCRSLADLAVKGNDLIAAGYAPGRELGEVLQYLFAAVLDGRAENTRENLLAAALAACPPR